MRAGTHVTLPYCWDMRSAGTYNTHHFSFHLHGWHTHTPMNHTHEHTHVSCHSFHHKTLFFSPCCKPCKLLCVCYIDSLICFVDLNFFSYIFRLQCFHWPTSFSTIFVMFIFRFILFMFGPTCASNIITFYSLVVIIVSAQNGSMSCQTHALHCMLISHGLLYMVMSKGLHVTDVDVFHTCN